MGDAMIRIGIWTARSDATADVDLAPAATKLPFRTDRSGSKPLAVCLLVLSVVTACVTVASVLGGMRKVLPAIIWMHWAFFLGPATAASALAGLRELVWRERYEFTPAEVRRRCRGLFGWREWGEPLSAYKGVLSRREGRTWGKNASSRTLYILTLQHSANKKRSVKLYLSRSYEGFRAKHEHYARLFGLPALVETATGVEKRRPEDLHKSVRQRVADGALKISFDPAARPPGRKLAVTVERDALLIRRRWNAFGIVGIPASAALLVGAMAIVLALAADLKLSLAFLLALAALDLVLVGGAYAAMRAIREELVVSPSEVRKRWRHPWGTLLETSVAASEIEEVAIHALPAESFLSVPGVTTVQVISDSPVLQFGVGLPKADKEWVRDCIIAVISK